MNKLWRAVPPTPRWLFLVAIAAPFFLSAFFPLEVRGLAALIVAGLVPGALLVYWLVAQSEAPPPWWEFWLYAVGAGYAVLVATMLLLSYLPGPLGSGQLLGACYALNLALLALIWQRARQSEQLHAPALSQSHAPAPGAVRWAAAGALVLMLLASYFRLGSLGYAEFLTDEARVVLRAAAVLQGYEDVLFIHRKGPAEILLPAAEFALAGQMNEAVARLPFAAASIVALFAVWLLGGRIFGGVAGWAAAFLLIFDGYLVGFAHFTQFQSIVLLTSVLTLLALHRLTRVPAAVMPYFILAALFMATGLLSHYDTLLVCLPAAALLAHLLWQGRASLRRVVRDLAPGCLLGAGLLALFYAPFLVDPHFQATYTYIVDRRIGGDAFPYNNLVDILRRSSVYNSTYYVGALAVLLWAGLGISYRRGWAGRAGRVAAGVAMVGGAAAVAAALLRPDLLRLGATDLTILAAVLLLAPLWFAPRLDAGWRMVWIWFSAGVVAAFFLVAFPRTHIYIFAVPAALLAGMVIASAQRVLARAFGPRPAHVAGGVVAAAAALLFGGYLHSYFIATDPEVLRTWPADHPALYWQPAAIDTIDAVYGFPLANGWKTVGVLYAQGMLQGSYESNQRDNLISYWYTRGAERCFSTAAHYFVIDNLEPWAESPDVARARVGDYGFAPWDVVTVNGEPRLEILQMGAAPAEGAPPRLALESSIAAFDALATPDLPLDYPIVEPPMAHRLDADFGGEIQLEGYAIENADTLIPGGVIQLRLFWRAQQPLSRSYTVFNQSYYGDGVMVAQQDSLPVCDRKPTTEWDPGELIVDSRTIPIAPDAPAGDYPLYVGLYDAETSARLPVLDANGAPVDDKVHVTDIRIAAP